MTWDQIAHRWDEFKGIVQARWNKLTSRDLASIAGDRQSLIDSLHQRYGGAREDLEAEVDEFTDLGAEPQGSRPGSGRDRRPGA
jgi:uncharacterized protein YjbJ (UPF0337 family)